MNAGPDQLDRSAAVRLLGAGAGWRVSDIVCRSGPEDAPFEEAHEWVSVSAVVAGTFAYRSTRGRALMTPGSVLLGNHGDCFCCSHEHGTGDRCVAFHFEPSMIEGVASDLRGVRQTEFGRHRLKPHETLAPLLADVRALLRRKDELLAEETALRIAAAALRAAHEVEDVRTTLSDEARAASAVALIDAEYAEPLTLGAMAEVAGLGRYHFLRVFRRVVGTTPYRYLLDRRLAVAVDALRDGSGVLEAMLVSGFGDLSEFTRRVGAKFGRSPGTFRREARTRGNRDSVDVALAAPPAEPRK